MSDLYYNLYRFNLNQKTSSVRFISISRGAFVIFVYLPLTSSVLFLQHFLHSLRLLGHEQHPTQHSSVQQLQSGPPNMAHDNAKFES